MRAYAYANPGRYARSRGSTQRLNIGRGLGGRSLIVIRILLTVA